MGLDPGHSLAAQFAAEKAGEGTDIRRDGHLVVVEDDDEILVEMAGVIQCLKGHACGHRTVADHGDGAILFFSQMLGKGNAEGGGNRG